MLKQKHPGLNPLVFIKKNIKAREDERQYIKKRVSKKGR
jgi:hypothetical protein